MTVDIFFRSIFVGVAFVFLLTTAKRRTFFRWQEPSGEAASALFVIDGQRKTRDAFSAAREG